ncbi:hypothetical protein GGTG_04784 [Gaeumannomyces tritici R3-111a-1]|uniref:Secreted protein n=1 Tax=Gaeumannomyces tritici (strain R3-111a-1) TaxID=644352 RepID=J3NU33_GAET3|nr:hypothetical protein GGTG_04784 [Gaeumannomyces tritici R3-111a-1]EJT79700.1 hypothetical protein GGTG_04784 [Gaeumannomyces tritici R3-111a-1]
MRLTSVLVSALIGLAAGQNPVTFQTQGTVDGGFAIPEDVAPGIYKVFIDTAGVAHHEKIGEPGAGAAPASRIAETAAAAAVRDGDNAQLTLEPRLAASAKLGKRQDVFWQYKCPDGKDRDHTLNHTDLTDAIDDLKNQCGDDLKVPSGWHIYATRGKVAAFFCNFQGLTNNCNRNTVETKRKDIIRECGDDWVAGWADWIMYIPGHSWSSLFSYGYHSIGDSKNFCGRDH